MYLKIALVLYRIVKTERQTKSGYGIKECCMDIRKVSALLQEDGYLLFVCMH